MDDIIKDLIKNDPYIYAMEFEDDILCLIDAIKDIHPYTQDGMDVKQEILNKLYREF